MRLFVAIDIPGAVRDKLSSYMERVRDYAPDAKWARVEGLHVTLKFLGEVKEEKLPGIKSTLSTVKSTLFEIAFEGIGFFPDPKSPRVFWAGVKAGAELPHLAKSIEDALVSVGFEREAKPYHPHLTLARARDKELRALTPLLEREATLQFGTMTAREFFLYHSQTGRGGSIYTKLDTFRLE